MSVQAPDAAVVRDALDRIYARAEFAGREAPALLQLIGELWTAVRLWLLDQLSRLSLPSGVAPWLPRVIIGLLAALALWSIAQLILTAGPARARPARPATRAVTESYDATAWEAAARRALDAGRYRDAVHALYQAAVLRLHERGAVRYHSGKTPGDYRREARGDAAAAFAFEPFVLQFLPLAFGAREPDAAAVEALWRAGAGLGLRAQPS